MVYNYYVMSYLGICSNMQSGNPQIVLQYEDGAGTLLHILMLILGICGKVHISLIRCIFASHYQALCDFNSIIGSIYTYQYECLKESFKT